LEVKRIFVAPGAFDGFLARLIDRDDVSSCLMKKGDTLLDGLGKWKGKVTTTG
jgi:hypothetical protein